MEQLKVRCRISSRIAVIFVILKIVLLLSRIQSSSCFPLSLSVALLSPVFSHTFPAFYLRRCVRHVQSISGRLSAKRKQVQNVAAKARMRLFWEAGFICGPPSGPSTSWRASSEVGDDKGWADAHPGARRLRTDKPLESLYISVKFVVCRFVSCSKSKLSNTI